MFVSVELSMLKSALKKKKFWKYLKVTAKPKVMKTSKRSLKMSRKVMEFEELKRVQTLYERSDKKWV